MPTTISDYTATLTFDPNLYASRFIEKRFPELKRKN